MDDYEKELEYERETLSIRNGLFGEYSWLPPLKGFNLDDTVFRWFRLKFQHNNVTPCLIKSCVPEIEPKWVSEEESLNEVLENGMYEEYSWLTWGLQNGISPGQPFLIGFLKPIWHQTSYEYAEWEADCYWELIRVLPNKPSSAWRSWDRVLRQRAALQEKRKRRAEHIRRLSLALTHHWELRTHHIGSLEHPQIKFCLYCSNSEAQNHLLAEGCAGGRIYDKDLESVNEPNDRNLAFSRLLDDFVERHPGVDPTPLFDLADTVGATVPIIHRVLYTTG